MRALPIRYGADMAAPAAGLARDDGRALTYAACAAVLATGALVATAAGRAP